ncbi:histidine kinase [Brachybacterium halotolerans subsp. kimchii]|uniref:sensor histidine kinase n=1 Tax=Brachybacterium halotolerans TaxID=2795215 RepID=UPI001E2D067B|nr:histidine kinase [Brachybacterium halotolerans]UEJ81150.1 histidine kinase [Brachybacterium halotolerans subsp. kimchii]
MTSSPVDAPAPSGVDHPPARGRLVRRLAEAGRMLVVSLACLVVGACLALILFLAAWDTYGESLPGRVGLTLVIDVGVGAVANLAAGPMRRAGLWNLLLVVPGALSGSALPAAAVGLARVGVRRDRRLDAIGLSLAAATGLIFTSIDRWAQGKWSSTFVFDILLSLVFAGAALLWGRVRGTRAVLITSLRSQAATAQREREALEREHEALAREHRALVAQAESEQRAAIARDMHDSLSHHLSLIAMHAGALSYRADMPPEQMRDVSATILADARAANSELRHVLSALRTDDAEPLPTGAHIGEQIERALAGGQDVHLEWIGTDPHDVDAAGSALVVTLARAVRELLTNARKHAPGQPLALRIAHEAGTLRLTSRNTVPEDVRTAASELGSGLGLTGLRERVRLLGGTMRAEAAAAEGGTDTDDDNGPAESPLDAPAFEVELSLPWPDHRTRDEDDA